MSAYLELVLFVVLWSSGLVVLVVGLVRAARRSGSWDERMDAVDVELEQREDLARRARALSAQPPLVELDLDWGWPDRV